MFKSVAALTVVVGLIAGSAFGVTASLTPVGVLTPTPGGALASQVNAISGDGADAVGWSNGVDSTGTATIHQPFIWSAATGIVRLGAASATASEARGVVVRTTNGKIGVGGFSAAVPGTPNSNGLMTYEAPLNNLGSGTWTYSLYPGSETGPYNASRLWAPSTAEGWFTAGKRYMTARALAIGVGATSVDFRTGGGNAWANSVSETGPSNVIRATGYDLGNTGAAKRAMYMNNINGTTQTVIPGTAAILSEAYGISVNGLKVCGYDTAADGSINPWTWNVGDAAISVLGRLAGDTQGAAIAINNAGMVAGYSSNGTTADEQAVIWDKTGVWSTTGQPINVRSRLAGAGVDVSAWSSFSRITSISNDGSIVGGYGVWAADGSTRVFVRH
jgi:hypothetical protein